jgi:oligopeptide/dipeptide ABC transporter ATP-binding protein
MTVTAADPAGTPRTVTPLLEVRGLTTEFRTREGTVHAVNGVDFSVAPSRIVGVVGESGCGKSVTVRSLLGLVRPPGRVTRGEARFEGQDLLAMSGRERRRMRGSRIGFVAQNPFGALNPVLRIRRQFANVIGAHRDVGRDEARRMAHEMLDAVGIPDPAGVLDGHAHQLSGGMAQRVVLAMALVLDPRLVIADEPTTALDVTIQRQILDLLSEQVRDRDRAMLIVTHDLGVVAQYCEDVVVMYAGKVVETGPVEAVFAAPAHPYTSALLAAVPRRGEPLHGLGGRLPDLIDYPRGCPYRERCPLAFEPCAEQHPPLEPVEDLRRRAACHADPEEVMAGAAVAG